MSGPKRNPDKLNTIGVVVVGICGAVLVYVTIVALQAFYMNNTSEIQTMADYGGQDTTARGHKAGEMANLTGAGKNTAAAGQEPTFRIPIEHAMELVVESAKQDPSHLIPALPASDKPTIEPVFGRPKAAAAPAEGGAAPGAATEPGAGSADAGAAGASAPMVPTGGSPAQPQPVAGAGSLPSTGAPAANPTGAAAPTNPTAQPGAAPARKAPAQPKAAGSAQPKAAGSAQPKTP